MKIVQINTFSYKAAGNIMMNLHNYMLQNGIDSYVAWGRGKNAENNHEYFMNDDIGVKIHGAYTRVTDKTGFASILSTKKLIKWLDEINPDIIHLHCIHGYYINIKILFEKKLKLFGLNTIVGLLQDIVHILMLSVVKNGNLDALSVSNLKHIPRLNY